MTATPHPPTRPFSSAPSIGGLLYSLAMVAAIGLMIFALQRCGDPVRRACLERGGVPVEEGGDWRCRPPKPSCFD
jgi:hypothetical protein